MKIILLFLTITFSTNLSVHAQKEYSIFKIRNYNQSLAMVVKQQLAAAIVSDEYGKISRHTNFVNADIKYLYHGQEYEKDLGLYFYPSRIYSVLSKRFLQTDPKSQHASPYSFLGGDPVNRIDETGNADKPLVLHHTEHELPDGKDFGFLDIQNQVGDAYYVPLGDFLSGNVPDLPEFNGTVYIDSHMAPHSGGILEVERDDLRARFKSPRQYKVARKVADSEEYVINIKAEDLGRELRDFAEVRNLHIKKIVAGGCEGAKIAEPIGEGFVQRPSNIFAKRFLRTSGLKTNRLALPVGEKFLEGEGLTGLEGDVRWHVHKKQNSPHYALDEHDESKFYGLVEGDEDDFIPFADGEELEDMVVHGRIPESVEGHFSKFMFEY